MSGLLLSLVISAMFPLVALAQTPKVGERAKDFRLPSAKGETIALQTYAGKTKVVLVFYRGYW